MKTSEFKMRLKQLGYYLSTYVTHVEVWSGDTRLTPYAEIWNAKIGACKINTGNIELIKLCIEYAETPIEERKDEKRYIVIIPDPESFSEERVYTLVRAFDGKIMISRPQEKRIHDNGTYHLTESEIKKNHGYLWQFAKEVQK